MRIFKIKNRNDFDMRSGREIEKLLRIEGNRVVEKMKTVNYILI